MALTDKKVSDALLQTGVVSAPDKLVGTAAENKAVFDRLIRNVAQSVINPVIDELVGIGGAGNIGTPDGSVQQHLDSTAKHIANRENPHTVTPAQIGAETPIGAQSKADGALLQAKQYTDTEVRKQVAQAGAVIADGEGNAENANRLGGISGENYLPEKITELTGAKSYEYAAPMASVARPSFAGRTVQEGTPGVDNPAAVKGVLNPWARTYTGEPVPVTAADVEPMMVLPNRTQDRIVLRDGVWGIERKVIALTFDGTQAEVHTNIGQQPVAEDVVCFYCNAYRYLKLAEQLGLSNRFPKPTAWDANEESIWINQYFAPCWKIKKYRLTGWSESLSEPERVALMNVWLAANPTQFYVKLPEPVFEPVPAWNGFGKIEPIAVTTSITKPNPDAPISPDNVAAITGTPVVTTGYRGQVRQLTAELFEGDSFDGVNLTTNGTVSRHDMDLPLSPGNYAIEAGDENGLLESVSIEILPDSAVFGRRVYPYRHIKEGTVHKLSGTPGAAQIIFNATDVYQDGDTWTLNGAAVSVTYADGQALLPTAVIAGDAVQAVVEREAVKHIAGVIMSEENLLYNWDFRGPTYTFDKLEMVGSVTAEKQAGYIMLNFGDDTSTWGDFSHLYESAELVRGKELTFSALCRAATNASYIFMNAHTGSGAFSVTKIVCDGQWRVVTCTGVVPDTAKKLSFTINGNIGAMEIACIKVEIGPRFTGWHEPKFDEIRLMLQKPTPQANTLINAVFDSKHLVNQRGQAAYTAGYGIDMWRNEISTQVNLYDGGIQIVCTANSDSGIIQKMENLSGQYTGIIIVTEVNGYGWIFIRDHHEGALRFTSPGIYIGTFENVQPGNEFYIRAGANSEIKVAAAKLEPGPRFTGWDEQKPGQTLAECQRYLLRNSPGNTVEIRASYVYNGGINFIIPIPITMRTSPAISTALENSVIEVRNMSNAAQSGFTFSTVALPGAIKITASKVNHGLSDAFLAIRNVLFTAEL